MRARDVLDEGGPLSSMFSGYERRDSQLEMTDVVERALEGDGVALVEAGTGTGKTLAYLVPAVLSGKKIVISTGTRALQDQLVSEDVPLLERALGERISVAVLKGLSNYVCLRRLDEARYSPEASRPDVARGLPIVDDWLRRTETGDRSELDAVAEDAPLWGAITSSTETRIGARCRHHEACYVTQARVRAESAQIVVVNHHLYFADLAVRRSAHGMTGVGVVPDHEAVIFDEAHRLEDVATQFFGVEVSSLRVEVLVRDAERALAAAGDREEETARLLRGILLRGADLFDRVPRGPEGTRTPLDAGMRERLRDALFGLDVALEVLAEHCRLAAPLSEAVLQMSRRADRMRYEIGVVAEPDKEHVVWTNSRGRSVSVGASPVDVSGLFREEVVDRLRSVVLTSATLATSGSFSFVKKRLGIDLEVDEVVLASPFDYPTQALLYLPDLPDPRQPGWIETAAEEVVALVRHSRGGAFVLSTSLRAMHELHRRAKPALRGLEVMLQGEQPRPKLLERFRDAGHAVLFATLGFWEGVDVPGEALRLVVLDRLPFDVPTDPLVRARCDRLEAEGGKPFMDYLVPSAAITLKQGFGRLIRTRRDRGVVAILDARVSRKGYGKVLLRSLPDAARADDIAQVEAFFAPAPAPSDLTRPV